MAFEPFVVKPLQAISLDQAASLTFTFRFFKSLTAQPKSSWDGNLQPPFMSSAD